MKKNTPFYGAGGDGGGGGLGFRGGGGGGQKLYIVKLPNKYNTYNGIL